MSIVLTCLGWYTSVSVVHRCVCCTHLFGLGGRVHRCVGCTHLFGLGVWYTGVGAGALPAGRFQLGIPLEGSASLGAAM